MIKLVFRTHFYEWEGTLYRQTSGGPIGLRASGLIGEILMDFWAEKVLEAASVCNEKHEENPVRFEPLRIHLLHKYVDDCFVAKQPLKLGTRWSGVDQAMVWNLETELEDRDNNVSKEANSMEQFAKMASQMLGCLNFTYDVPQNNPNNRMPVLDTEIWIGQEQREIGIPPEILENNQISAKPGKLKNVTVAFVH